MKCIRCDADPQPANFGSPRRCAFDAEGNFTSNNWNCATIDALLTHQQGDDHYGDDETMQVVSARVSDPDPDGYGDSTDGWIVLARYKHRGCTGSARHIHHGSDSTAVTLKLVEDVLAAYEPTQKADAVGLSVEDRTDSPRAQESDLPSVPSSPAGR